MLGPGVETKRSSQGGGGGKGLVGVYWWNAPHRTLAWGGDFPPPV